ncbi:MAG: CoA transferase [Deltaproteobacteria bacterium]|nr:CoA transferase [Deltaproteobacteria bacterium]
MSRIIDLGFLAGAYATRLLVEAGHDVIRIDPPHGDALRRVGPFLGNVPHLERGAYHHFLNAGKRSLSINLESPTGRELFLELLQKADALVTSQPLPVEENELRLRKSNLVLAQIEEEGAELCAYARSGLLSLTGQPDGRPTVLGGHMIYLATGIYVAIGTSTALFVQKQTGQGQTVSVSMRDCLETFVEQAMVEYTFSGTKTERRGSRGSITAISGAMACKDGHWVVSQINRPGRWEEFTAWVQDPELMADPSLARDEIQHEKKDFIMDRILAWANRFTKAELVEEAQRRHFPASPVSTPLDLVNDPQLIARGYLSEIALGSRASNAR